jgi:NADH:ubiquinone oxidoreductase subunit 5 (subunit L)/multisubunit Na+/H+ antiporter MnhA subunit
MLLDDISPWLVWILPLIASLFVPIIAKKGDKIRNYYVIAIAAVTAALALSLVPTIFSGSEEAINLTVSWLPGISAGVFVDSLSVLFTVLLPSSR